MGIGTAIADITKRMDNMDSVDKSSEHYKTSGIATVFCKLFSDTVTRHLCDLRRRELNAHGIFSCEGCDALTNEGSISSI